VEFWQILSIFGSDRMITEAVEKLGLGWSLCFIGEDQAGKLGALTTDLRRGVSETGDAKQITSGFSYWGVGPTIAWLTACKDHLYPVMNQSIANFANLWNQLFSGLESQAYEYVSLGVGSGEKDRQVLQSIFGLNSALHYFPVDMSPEMLRIGAREATRDTQIERRRVLPIQIDFSFEENVRELRDLLDVVIGENAALISLLGNTLSNFDDDRKLLETIRILIRPGDRLLLEVAFTESLSEEAQKAAAAEYAGSRMFKEFVSSSLVRNTDLHVDTESVSFSSSPERDRAILIKALYRNRTGGLLKVALPDRTTIDFPENDTVRLLTMRKYTERGIDKMLADCGFRCLKRARKDFPNKRNFRFGTELLLLQSCEKARIADAYAYDIFLAHAGADAASALELYSLLTPRCAVFLDKRNVKLGDDWDLELSAAQRQALVTVVLVSSNTGRAYYQREEIAAAIQMAREDKSKHRVVPVFLDEAGRKAVPYGLVLKHGVTVSPEHSLKEVAEDLTSLLAKIKQGDAL
jgi:L-histidine Nalpha-methyltransferase